MRNTRNVWLVARREIITRARSRAFQLSTIVLALFVAGGVGAGQFLPTFFERDPQRVGLLPAAVPLRDSMLALSDALDVELETFELGEVTDFASAMEQDGLDAIVVAPDRLVFDSSEDETLLAIVRQAAFEASLPVRAESLGLTVEEARELIAPVALTTELIEPRSDDEDRNYGIVSITSILLLIAMSQYGQWVLVGVIEEKSNRVVEVLLAVVAPWQLLMGKVLGILALAVLQIGTTLAAVGLAVVLFEDVSLPEAGGTAIALAVSWLLLGLLLYNFFYAAVGATASRPEDASSAMAPVLAPLMLGYFAALTYVPGNPDAIASQVLSIFPLTSPLVMPARVVAGGGSTIEMIIAVVLMLMAIAVFIWLAGKIYESAILRTQREGLWTALKRLAREGR